MRNVPALAGLPAIVPVVTASFSPRGSGPFARLHRNAATPPRVAILTRYARPAVALGSPLAAIASRGRTTRVTVASFAAPLASTRWADSVNEPARVGTPLRTPSEPTVTPGGRLVADHLYGAWPPVALSDERTGIPTSAARTDVRTAIAV